jgi:hypothetical protein
MQSAAIPPLSGQHSKFLCLVELARAAERTCSVTGLRQTPCRKPRTYMGTSKLFSQFYKIHHIADQAVCAYLSGARCAYPRLDMLNIEIQTQLRQALGPQIYKFFTHLKQHSCDTRAAESCTYQCCCEPEASQR